MVSYFKEPNFSGLYFSGTIANMDFSGRKFEHCVFNQVTWKSCLFNEKTYFKSCHFFGGRIIQSDSIGKSKIIDPKFDRDAKQFIFNSQISMGKKQYDEEDLKNDISQVIKKFIRNLIFNVTS